MLWGLHSAGPIGTTFMTHTKIVQNHQHHHKQPFLLIAILVVPVLGSELHISNHRITAVLHMAGLEEFLTKAAL